jgi:hypothetical protein
MSGEAKNDELEVKYIRMRRESAALNALRIKNEDQLKLDELRLTTTRY